MLRGQRADLDTGSLGYLGDGQWNQPEGSCIYTTGVVASQLFRASQSLGLLRKERETALMRDNGMSLQV